MRISAVRLHREDDEVLDVYLVGSNGELHSIGTADHDQHGWAGMDAVEKMAINLARVLEVEVMET